MVLSVKKDTTREILGIYNNPTEGSGIWEDFFMDLQKRGIKSIQLVVTDGLIGIENTIAKYFPMADIQLCTVHLKRNMIHKVKPENKTKLAVDLKEIFDPFQKKLQNFFC